MDPLTGKQKRFLRGLGQRLAPAVHVGKAGLSETIVSATDKALSHRELLKVRLPAEKPAARRQIARDLAEALDAHCVGVVGRTALLYRPNEALPADRRVVTDWP